MRATHQAWSTSAASQTLPYKPTTLPKSQHNDITGHRTKSAFHRRRPVTGPGKRRLPPGRDGGCQKTGVTGELPLYTEDDKTGICA
ncbi:MAG: hypothetical protein LBS44_04210 [Deltaproteobacteria bacterium]|nr:hypothetical protein [Deltaproteobacteria bacterium]